MKFDYIIGNPPYQESYHGDSTGANSVYDKFMSESYKIAKKSLLIHPARFLFNAGSTPKKWNEKMLNDEHLKVLYYDKNATNIFKNTDIKGGIAITLYDKERSFGAIGVFTPFEELNSILHKVINSNNFSSISQIAVTSSAYHFTEKLHEEHPDLRNIKITINGKEQPLLSKGHEYDLKSSIFEKLPEIFHDKEINDSECIQILGRSKTGRVKKYVKKIYINDVINLNKYKIFLPKADGVGSFGDILTDPLIEEPGVGATETFYSIGLCDNKDEIENILKYIKSKFARSLLGVLKITQDINPGKWKYVPLQDFTENSDIDWSVSVEEIDKQLYKKYGLSDDEIKFIDDNVKEMT